MHDSGFCNFKKKCVAHYAVFISKTNSDAMGKHDKVAK